MGISANFVKIIRNGARLIMYECFVFSLFVCLLFLSSQLFVFYFSLSRSLTTGTFRFFASCVELCFSKAQVAIRLSIAVIKAFNSEFLARMGHRSNVSQWFHRILSLPCTMAIISYIKCTFVQSFSL